MHDIPMLITRNWFPYGAQATSKELVGANKVHRLIRRNEPDMIFNII